MTTNKNRIQTYVNDDVLAAIARYCSSNGNISHSKAVAMILEDFFSVKKEADLRDVDKVIDKAIDDCLAGTENSNTVTQSELNKMIDDKLSPLLDKLSHFESLLEKLEKKDDSLGELDSESLNETESEIGITDTDTLDNTLESHSESLGANVELDEANPISEPQKTFSVQDVCCNSGWSARKIQRESKISNLENKELLIPSYDYSRAFKLIEGTKPYRFIEVTLELFNEWLMSA